MISPTLVVANPTPKNTSKTNADDALDATKSPGNHNIVAHIQPGYTLILNKFNTVPDHALLVTDLFSPQEWLLRPSDFAAW